MHLQSLEKDVPRDDDSSNWHLLLQLLVLLVLVLVACCQCLSNLRRNDSCYYCLS